MAHSDPKAVEVARDLLAQEARAAFTERWAVEKRNLVRVPYDWAPDHRWVEVVIVRDK